MRLSERRGWGGGVRSSEFMMLGLVYSSPEWAESLTEMGKGKHFIGDFLPPEELEKFMETFKALKVSFPVVIEAEV